MICGNKAEFINSLEDVLPECLPNLKTVEECEAVIHDGHAVMQTLSATVYMR